MNASGISKFRLEVCSFEWSSHPTSVRARMHPEPASGAPSCCAPLAEVGECGACSGRACGVSAVRAFRGFASRWASRGPIGVLVASPRSANGRWWECPPRLPRLDTTGEPFGERVSASEPRAPVLGRSARGAVAGGPLLEWGRRLQLNLLHRMEQDYPLNLSISLSGGKETNRDAPSNGE